MQAGFEGPKDTPSTAKTQVSALSARIETAGEKVRLLFELTAPAPVTAFPVANPSRIIVDLPEVVFRIAQSPPSASAANKLIKSYRYGLFAPGRSRVVIELAAPAKIVKSASEPAEAGKAARLVIELAPTDAARFAAAVAEHARAAPAEPPKVSPPAPAPPGDKPVVVIDPGHGGVDNGAVARYGELEKNIVFEFAKVLHAKIEAGGKLRPVMTRTEDIFVPLADRVKFARDNHAALFISIHADTLGEPNVSGATVYTVSAQASDAEAARIAEKENLADQAGGLERKEDAEEVGDILFELTRRETRAYSAQFSQSLISFWKQIGNLNKNPSRAAGFVVLKAYDVPSVLLELGYLSSEKDLSRLTSPQWRDRAAQKTADAIDGFFAARSREARMPQEPPRPQ
ncbi:MAG: N-acetylmuramoyl-L-alanine amidase [Methylocystis sp.]|nr:N-acetylmuramoyl-L-alanine amidase [Methylocystis sp.]